MHVFDPARFPYGGDTHYAPTGQEIGTAAQLDHLLAAYGTRHALLVAPNSGYAFDNACLLDTIARGRGRYKGVALVRNDTTIAELAELKALDIVGVAWNVTHFGVDYYRGAGRLLEALRMLDMLVDVQVEDDQLLAMLPLLMDSGVRIVVDHCGRPDVAAGLGQPGFRALLELGAGGQAFIKLSGLVKFSRQIAPHEDAWPFVTALVEAFTLERCLWASDWPHLRAPSRVDYGVLLALLATLFPDPGERRRLVWETPRQLFGFAP